ncbi:AAA domain-containing protein, partial [Candidatus Poribacteria bacterium]|nr:AAA domain-containing protein [Candidatus Poribacteria bacterium]
INTKHILFFVSGAFNKLDEVIKKRMHKQGIGFGAEIIQNQESENYLEECKSVDFIEYGFEPEFVGRLPVRVVCYELSVEDLYNILKHSEGSIVKQYQNAFKAYGIDVIFSDESLWRIAEKAYEEKTGARALSTVCEKTMREFKFELPSSEIKHFVVTSEMVNDPKSELKKLMENPKANKIIIAHELLKEYEKQFMTKHQIKLSFSDEAAGLISQKSEETQKDIKGVCDEILIDFEYGLNLIKRNTGKTEFTITKEVILDPSGTLDKWFKEYYNKQ